MRLCLDWLPAKVGLDPKMPFCEQKALPTHRSTVVSNLEEEHCIKKWPHILRMSSICAKPCALFFTHIEEQRAQLLLTQQRAAGTAQLVMRFSRTCHSRKLPVISKWHPLNVIFRLNGGSTLWTTCHANFNTELNHTHGSC